MVESVLVGLIKIAVTGVLRTLGAINIAHLKRSKAAKSRSLYWVVFIYGENNRFTNIRCHETKLVKNKHESAHVMQANLLSGLLQSILTCQSLNYDGV